MKALKKIIKYTLWGLVGLILLIVGSGTVLYYSADMGRPDVVIDTTAYRLVQRDGYRQVDSSYLRQNDRGVWELYLVGDPLQRGLSAGALMSDLLHYQEQVFVDQIRQIVPSDNYLGFLRTMLVIFNRNMGKYVPLEYREEILGISQYCSHEWDAIGTPYERQLNYHAAHDIGHTMQQYMLVGCSSFAAWGGASADSSLIVGRNFDFYVGDNFARNKVVMFYAPTAGHKFATVSWAGMTGVLSGMNDQGLTVTINAATGSIPTSAATPISILVREILQYASTIEQAEAIAHKRHTFVNESIMVSSKSDGYAVVIEKTTKEIDTYRSSGEYILCTNHYQSPLLRAKEFNIENIKTTDSQYRLDRLGELVEQHKPISPQSAAAILRDRYGRGGEDVGLGNEMTLNQSIAHHSVIFKPSEGLMWVSTEPWQSGSMVCYDLNRIFAEHDFSKEIARDELTIAPDSVFMSDDYPRLIEFRGATARLRANVKFTPREVSDFVALNPHYFYTYKIIGDMYLDRGSKSEARDYYKRALECKIPRQSERGEIEKILKKL